MIDVVGISKSFDSQKAVDDISFHVNEGETLVLLGKSGCGKTTTLRMLNRLIDPSAGLIKLNGKDISLQNPEKLRRGIGYVLQHHGLFPHYTVEQNVAIVPKLLKWEKSRIRQRAEELLDKLKLPPAQFFNSYPSQLSGGQQQRVGLARALMADPPLLLMDEPLGALDTLTRTAIRREFNQLDELKRKTIVMVTHDIIEAFELAERICLMDQGKIIQIGTPYELLFKPSNGFVSSFFGDQRLQLELTALTVEDVWLYITGKDDVNIPDSLPPTINLWEALARLIRTEKKFIRFRHHSGESKVGGYKDLMTAYSEFKNRHHE